MLVSMSEVLEKAKGGGYGVLAPNVFNKDSVRVCIETAVGLDSPLIVDILPNSHKDIASFEEPICSIANEIRIPIVLNLDHGDNFKTYVRAIYGGFTGVMVDRSASSFEGNAQQVVEFKNICVPPGVTVEAEFGQIADGCNYEGKRDEYLTDPVKAKEFVEESDCDCLAVSVGETRGEYTGKRPDIDFERLKEIKNLVDVPLVFHGSSFSGLENVAEYCRIGIQEVNMETDAYSYGLDYLFHGGRYRNGENVGARVIDDIIWAGCKERVMDYMKVTGSAGKNWIKIEN